MLSYLIIAPSHEQVSSPLPFPKHYSIECNYFLNAGGPHAANIAEMAQIGSKSHPSPLMHAELPVRPRKRCVFVLSCPDGPSDMPMMIDPSGFYIRKESQKSTYICGISPDQVIVQIHS